MGLATDLTAVTLELGPFAYYRCNETSGTALVDSSTSALNGTYTSTTVGGATNTMNSGAAATFNGTTSIATTGVLASNANLGGTNFAVSLWVTLSTVVAANFYYLCCNGNTGSTTGLGFTIYKNSSSQIIYGMRTSSTVVSLTGGATTMVASKLYHIVGVLDSVANAATLYVNGVADTPGTYARSGTSPNAVTIGALTGPTNFTPGQISEVSLFAKALSAAQVKMLYYAGTHVQTTQQFRQLGLIR